MRFSVLAFAPALLFLWSPITASTEVPPPRAPNTAVEDTRPITVPTAPEVPARTAADAYPASVSIPAIGLKAPIERMGVLPDGKLDVPSGKTNNVGWYKDGTVPGQEGSAVFDAHVFAAFSNLKNVTVGTDIYVTTADGTKLHFKVEEKRTYPLAQVPAETLFNRIDGRRLNLITCAGSLTADRATYTHRLIVYAVLVE